MMRREGGRVLIDISADEWNWLLLALEAGTAMAEDVYGKRGRDQMLRLTNAINEGNTDFTPYQVPPSTETALDG